MNKLHHRIIEISKKYGLCHLGSNLTSVDIIDEIYSTKKSHEPFILSCGHCGLALYVVLEKEYGLDAELLYLKHGVHPNRCLEEGIYCSTGSLGHGLPIALGLALTNRQRSVYCLISDGECFEGSIYEAMNVIRRYKVDNLKIYINFNGFSAYSEVEEWILENMIRLFPHLIIRRTNVEDFGLKGLLAHYVKL